MKEFTRRFFQRAARQHGDTFEAVEYFSAGSFRAAQRGVARLLPAGCRGLVLDAGCGTGAMTEALGRRRTVVGIDFSEASLRVARHRLEAVCGDTTALPFPAGRFALTLTVNVIQHLDRADGLATIAEAARVTAPGGRVIVATLNGESAVRRLLRPRC